MRMFTIPKGTECTFIQDGKEWYSGNFTIKPTCEEHNFFIEDITIDPLGHVGLGPQNARTIGGQYAKNGWYGFNRDGWTILVPAPNVKVN